MSRVTHPMRTKQICSKDRGAFDTMLNIHEKWATLLKSSDVEKEENDNDDDNDDNESENESVAEERDEISAQDKVNTLLMLKKAFGGATDGGGDAPETPPALRPFQTLPISICERSVTSKCGGDATTENINYHNLNDMDMEGAIRACTTTTTRTALSMNISSGPSGMEERCCDEVVTVSDCPNSLIETPNKKLKTSKIGVEEARITSGLGAHRGRLTHVGGRLGAKDGYARMDEGVVSQQKRQCNIDVSGAELKAMTPEMIKIGMEKCYEMFNSPKKVLQYGGRVASMGVVFLNALIKNLKLASEHYDVKEEKMKKLQEKCDVQEEVMNKIKEKYGVPEEEMNTLKQEIEKDREKRKSYKEEEVRALEESDDNDNYSVSALSDDMDDEK